MIVGTMKDQKTKAEGSRKIVFKDKVFCDLCVAQQYK
jgi:hypothetical protein